MENAYQLDPVFLDLLKPTYYRLLNPGGWKDACQGFLKIRMRVVIALYGRVPKHTWHGPKRVRAAYLAALYSNCGAYEARSVVMFAMDITPAWLEASVEKKDRKRFYGARIEAKE